MGNTHAPEQQKRILEQFKNIDVFFATGNVLTKLFPIGDLKTPVCYVSIRETARIPPESADLYTGVIRGSFTTMLTMAQNLMGDRKKMGFIYRAESNIANQTLKAVRKAVAKNDIELYVSQFSSVADIKEVMRKMKENSDFVLLFPPVIRDGDLEEIIKRQNQFGIPVFSQLRKRIEAGAVGGMTIDVAKINSSLSSNIDKIARGVSPSELPTIYSKPKYVINRRVAEMLGLNISERIMRRAEIIN